MYSRKVMCHRACIRTVSLRRLRATHVRVDGVTGRAFTARGVQVDATRCSVRGARERCTRAEKRDGEEKCSCIEYAWSNGGGREPGGRRAGTECTVGGTKSRKIQVAPWHTCTYHVYRPPGACALQLLRCTAGSSAPVASRQNALCTAGSYPRSTLSILRLLHCCWGPFVPHFPDLDCARCWTRDMRVCRWWFRVNQFGKGGDIFSDKISQL